MLIAVVDMGSNTFHLLIKSVDKKTLTHQDVFKKQYPVKLGHGIEEDKKIAADSLSRAFIALWDIKTMLNSLSVQTILAFATSATRSASNGKAFAQKASEILGAKVSVIDGIKEAELIYKGIKNSIDLKQNKALVMDIGGGSVEFIICSNEQIFESFSYEIGGIRMTERFHKSDPISKNEIAMFKEFFNANCIDLLAAIQKHQPQYLAGAAGSFETLAKIIYIEKKKQDFPEYETNVEMPINYFNEVSNKLIALTKTELANTKGMVDFRVNLMVVSTLMIQFVLEVHDFTKMYYVDYSLKEGIFFDYLENNIKK